jgi:hypothetical protein
MKAFQLIPRKNVTQQDNIVHLLLAGNDETIVGSSPCHQEMTLGSNCKPSRLIMIVFCEQEKTVDCRNEEHSYRGTVARGCGGTCGQFLDFRWRPDISRKIQKTEIVSL